MFINSCTLEYMNIHFTEYILIHNHSINWNYQTTYFFLNKLIQTEKNCKLILRLHLILHASVTVKQQTLKNNWIGSESSRNLMVHWYSTWGSPFLLFFRNISKMQIKSNRKPLNIYYLHFWYPHQCKMEKTGLVTWHESKFKVTGSNSWFTRTAVDFMFCVT